jgi:hypothetical protein
MPIVQDKEHTEISIPESCFSHSDASSDVSLIKDYPTTSKRTKVRQRRFWYPKANRTSQIMWKVYIPSLIVVLVLLGVVGAYAYHVIVKTVPTPSEQNSNNANGVDSATIKNIWTRKFDSRDGIRKRGQPLNSFEVARYQLCEARFEEQSAPEFVQTQCAVCAQDYGIVSLRVLNLCIAGSMMAPVSKQVCEWNGIRCNLQGQVHSIIMNTPNPDLVIPSDLGYFEQLEVLNVQSTSVSNNPSTSRVLPSEILGIPSLKELVLTRLNTYLELPDQRPMSRLRAVRLDDVLLNQLPLWLSDLPMEHFSLSNIAIGTTPRWFQGSLWTNTIKSFRIQNCTMLPLPSFHFPSNVTVEIN